MKTFKSIFLCLLLLCAFLLTNCYAPPASIMKLTPEHINLEWFRGKQISAITNDSVSILLSFDRTANNNYLFDFEVFNNSENIILVSPELFYFKTLESTNKKKNAASLIYAQDPEKIILELQKAYSLHQTNVETQNMFYAFGYFLQFANQTKAVITNDASLSQEVDGRTQRLREDELLDDVKKQRIEQSLSSSTYLWEILALRKTTLRKDQSIGGKVFFPVDATAKRLEFFFPVEEYELKISFDQEVYFK